MFRHVIVLVTVILVAVPCASVAQWQLDGTPLCTAANDQLNPVIVTDGAGGAIVAWTDQRGVQRVFVQRINSSGVVQWAWDGMGVSNAGSEGSPVLLADGAGGAIVVWLDYRAGNNDIYAQRINAAGVAQWTPDGVGLLIGTTTLAYDPAVASDGAGGAIVTWWDARNLTDYNIYAQRVNGSGVVQWTANGVLVCGAPNNQNRPDLAPDGSGGAIIAWEDERSEQDIYAQRLNASGVAQWTANGIPLCTAAGQQDEVAIVSNGAGGAIMTWYDSRSGGYDIYAARVDGSGATPWTADGVALCTAGGNQFGQRIVTDGAGGAIVTWHDLRGANYDVYAQHINATGSTTWKPNGVPVSVATNGQLNPAIVADGSGGAIIAWDDQRPGPIDIYAQHLTALGAPMWTVDGLPFSAAANHQRSAAIAEDGVGGAIIAFQDNREDFNDNNLYAQRIDGRYGYWGRIEPILDSATDNPHDQGGRVALNWRASDKDVLNQQFIYSYTIWRAVDAATAQSLASSGAATIVDQPMGKATKPAQRVVWHELNATTNYYWELIGSQIADYDPTYSFLASTRQDSTAASTATHYFRVVAQGSSQFYTWASNVLSAHSVDNLAPPAPLLLTAQRVGADVHLTWNRVHVIDLKNYTVYRKTSTGVTPVVTNFLSDAPDSLLTDANAPIGPLYYIVTANDVHGNRSTPSNEAAVSGATGVGNLPPVTTLTVLQNYPNPFTGETQFQVGLPARGDVRVEIYDVAGRRVRNVLVPAQEKGWGTLRISARDNRGAPLASGVYFFRVRAGNQTITRKMVIAR